MAGTPRVLRAMNDRAALDLLLEHGPLSRTRIGKLTGLSKPTASQLLARLEAAGLSSPPAPREGRPGPQRPAVRGQPGRRLRRRPRRHPRADPRRRRRHHRPHRRRVRAARPRGGAPTSRRPAGHRGARRGRQGRRARPRRRAPARHRHPRRLRPAPPAGCATPRTCPAGTPPPCSTSWPPRCRCRSSTRTTSTSPPSPSSGSARPAATTTSSCCGTRRASAPPSSSAAGCTAASPAAPARSASCPCPAPRWSARSTKATAAASRSWPASQVLPRLARELGVEAPRPAAAARRRSRPRSSPGPPPTPTRRARTRQPAGRPYATGLATGLASLVAVLDPELVVRRGAAITAGGEPLRALRPGRARRAGRVPAPAGRSATYANTRCCAGRWRARSPPPATRSSTPRAPLNPRRLTPDLRHRLLPAHARRRTPYSPRPTGTPRHPVPPSERPRHARNIQEQPAIALAAHRRDLPARHRLYRVRPTGAATDDPNAETTITFWHGWSAAQRGRRPSRRTSTRSRRSTRTSTVKVVGNITDDKINQALRAGGPQGPGRGLVVHDRQRRASSAPPASFVDLTPFLEKSEIDPAKTFPKPLLDYTQFEGKRCTLPLLNDAYGLYYNKDAFEEAGITAPPKTLSEFDEVAQQADQDQGRHATRSSASCRTTTATRPRPTHYAAQWAPTYFDAERQVERRHGPGLRGDAHLAEEPGRRRSAATRSSRSTAPPSVTSGAPSTRSTPARSPCSIDGEWRAGMIDGRRRRLRVSASRRFPVPDDQADDVRQGLPLRHHHRHRQHAARSRTPPGSW